MKIKFRKKIKIILSGIIVLIIITYYHIDKEIFMKHRVLRHSLWEFDSGEKIREGDFINLSST
jgi:hypothetical protein